MDAGAFSDDKVAEASKKLVNVYVDCTAKGANADLTKKYAVRGYPTIKFLDAEGNVIADLRSRKPEDIAKQMEEVAAGCKEKKGDGDDGDKKGDDEDEKPKPKPKEGG